MPFFLKQYNMIVLLGYNIAKERFAIKTMDNIINLSCLFYITVIVYTNFLIFFLVNV